MYKEVPAVQSPSGQASMLPIPIVLCNNSMRTVHPKFTPKELIDGVNEEGKTLFQHLSGLKESKNFGIVFQLWIKKPLNHLWLIGSFYEYGTIGVGKRASKFTIGQLSPRDVYKMYLDFLPKRRSFDKYIKGKKDDKYNSNVLEYLAKYYQVSQREVRDYLEILSKDDITEILLKYGLDKKEIKKWLKQ